MEEENSNKIRKYSRKFYEVLNTPPSKKPGNQFFGRKKGNKWTLTEKEVKDALNNETKQRHIDVQKGHIFIFQNNCMPNIFKVNVTSGSVEEKLDLLNQNNDLPHPFEIAKVFDTHEPSEDIKIISKKLSEYHLQGGSDYYDIDFDLLLEIINRNCTRYGYVYVLSNPSMPDMYKIGHTFRDVEDRVSELTHTSLPTQFEIQFSIRTSDPEKHEKIIHKRLDQFRVQANREFFKTNLETIVDSIKNICQEEFE